MVNWTKTHPASGSGASEGTADQAIRIALRSGVFNPLVQFLSPTGEELARAYSGVADWDVQLKARLSETERYVVRVMAHNDQWTFPNLVGYEIEVRPAVAPR